MKKQGRERRENDEDFFYGMWIYIYILYIIVLSTKGKERKVGIKKGKSGNIEGLKWHLNKYELLLIRVKYT